VIIRELVTLLGFDLNDGPLKKYDKQIDATKGKSNMLAKAAHGVGIAYKVAAAAVAIGIGWISKNIVDSTIEMEGYRSEIQAFTGDAESAAEALAELRDKTIDPLFGTGNLVKAYKQLRTIGTSADDTSRMIDVLGDVANGSAENFNSLSNILTRTAATGKFGSMQLNQLAQAGFGAQDMAQGLGISIEQLNRDLDAGKIGYKELARAMEGATKEGGRFYQNAARQALTLSGSIKILQDVISSMGDAIGTKVLPGLVSLIRYVTNLIQIGNTGLVNFGAKAFDRLIHIIYQVLIFFEVMQMRIKRLGLSFEPLKGIFQDVFGLLGTVISAVVPVLYNLAAVIVAAFKPIRAFIRPIIEALKPIIQDVFGFAAEMIGALVPVVQGLTPHFEKLGERIRQLLDKVRPVLKNIMDAIKAAFEPIKAFVIPIIEALKPIFIDVFNTLSGLLDNMGESTSGLAGFIESLTPVFRELGQFVGDVIKGLWYYKDVIMALAVAYGIWTAAQWALNAASAVNPVTWIILGIVALIFAIYELIKHWDKIGPAVMRAFQAISAFFTGIGQAIAGFFTSIWSKMTHFFASIAAFAKKNLVNIVNVVVTIIFPLAGIVMALVRLIIKHWDTIKAYFSELWDNIKNIAAIAWEGIKNTSTGVIDGIKVVWGGLVSFFSGLWEAIKQGPATVVEYISNIFSNLWDSITDKFFGFINIIKDGWEKVKGVFGGLFEGAVNFFTGGPDKGAPNTKPVNDLIVTPEGKYSTHPDDYIIAMQEPTSLIDALTRLLGQGQLRPAYAGGSPDNSLVGNVIREKAQQNTYNNSNASTKIDSKATITVNVPAGTTAEQAATIARQVDQAVKSSLANAIGGARGMTPSPEARRH
jgi:phage-related protein